MKLLKIALVLLALPLLAIGGDGIYHAAISRQQVTVSCDELVREPRRALWVRVTGCSVDYLGAGYYRESGGRITELFLPARPALQPKTNPAALVISTKDPEVLALLQATVGGGQEPDQEAFLVMMLRVVTKLAVSRDVDGFVPGGIAGLVQARRARAALNAPVAPQFVVLDLHAEPSFMMPAIVAAAGLALLLAGLSIRWRRKRGRAGEAEAEESGAVVTPATPAVAEVARRIPPAMLLNLDASAGTSDIEHAPPLGGRTEVVARIAENIVDFGETGFDAEGRRVLSGPDWTLLLDIGTGEVVWTVTAEARGDRSLAPLAELARRTGWRIYLPKRGEFVEPSDLDHLTGTGSNPRVTT